MTNPYRSEGDMAQPELYQKHPVEAMQCDGTLENKTEIHDWVGQTLTPYDMETENMPPDNGVTISSEEVLYIRQDRQMARVENTDYVVKNVDGRFEVQYYEHFERDYNAIPS